MFDKKYLQQIGLVFVLLICLILSGCFSKSGGSSSGLNLINSSGNINADYIQNQLLVRIKSGTNIDGILREINGRMLRYDPELDYYQVEFGNNEKLNVLVAKRMLMDSNQVLLAEPNFLYKAYNTTPNDQEYSKQWGMDKINAPAAWDYSTGSNTVTIAIIDTGIDNGHPDLTGKVSTGYNAITRMVGLPGDDNGHGTHVSGIAAALGNNSTGVAGVAWNCRLMAVKVLDYSGSGSTDNIIQGIEWAVDHGADVISMSLGGRGYSRLFENAVDYAINHNVVVVAAAGNDSRLIDDNYPSCYPGVISVGATNASNGKAFFSTESNQIFIAAPGENIYSTLPGRSYGYLSGTSMATPFVSGAVALIKSKYGKNISITQVCSQIERTAADLGSSGWDQQTGWGLLNLEAVLASTSLQSNDFGTLIVTVNDGVNPLPNAQVLLTDNTGRGIYNILSGTSDASGSSSLGKACFWSLLAGSYTVRAEKDGLWKSTNVTVSGGGVSNITLSLNYGTPGSYTAFSETAENSPSLVTPIGTWGKTTTYASSTPNSWTDSPSGNYDNRANMSLISVPIIMTGSTTPHLLFWHRYDTENYCDYCRVEVSTDNGSTWTQLASWAGTQSSWTQASVSLAAYNTVTNLLIRFRFTSDGSVVRDGWYIDDISITGN